MNKFSINTAGMAQFGQRILRSNSRDYIGFEYHLWVRDAPKLLSLSHRYDTEPGTDPIQRLFDELPSIYEDHNPSKSAHVQNKQQPPLTTSHVDRPDANRTGLAAYDAAFVRALWPLANSGLTRVLLTSSDKQAETLWWAARQSFALWDVESPDEIRYNSIRNTFMQHLAGLMDDLFPHHRDAMGLRDVMSFLREKRTSWIYYCWWISIGRPDKLSPFPELRRDDDFGNTQLADLLCWDKCVVCGSMYSKEGEDADKKKRAAHLYCSGCVIVGNPHYYHLKRRYCSGACRRLDLEDHFPRCRQQKTFLHGVCLLESLARRYGEATFTGTVASHSAALFDDMPESAPCTLRRASESHAVFPCIFAKAHWTGESVFLDPVKRGEVLGEAGGASHAMLAWDAGEHIYIHLRPLILDIFKELNVYVRNAESISFLGDDLYREDNSVSTNKGKNPMFWPHQVLYCRLRDTGAEFVIDLRSLIFGWRTTVLPFDVFSATRLAAMAGRSVSLFDESATDMVYVPYYYVAVHMARTTVLIAGLIAARDRLRTSRRIHPDNLAKLTSSLGGFLGMRDARWQAVAVDVADAAGETFESIADEVRETRKHRQYLWMPTNPYSHEYRVGVTNSDDQLELYTRVWMSRKGHRRDIGGIRSGPMKPKNPLWNEMMPGPRQGRDAREVSACWLNRLLRLFDANSPVSDPPPAIDVVAVLGDMARAFEIEGAAIPLAEKFFYQDIYEGWQNTVAELERNAFHGEQVLVEQVGELVDEATGDEDPDTVTFRNSKGKLIVFRRFPM
ncbi:hypothetical protein ACRALDRAFT_1081682 [Sodiomyces alcalophilus JCM 7366]|uniref:uncharacterized protein n=1 Tax=Sodiomyces alcalophilus JCM 7366 TaxID=591952 RepID=UPI0039B4F067